MAASVCKNTMFEHLERILHLNDFQMWHPQMEAVISSLYSSTGNKSVVDWSKFGKNYTQNYYLLLFVNQASTREA